MSYTRLDDWLKTHTGYVNNLVCRSVPGSGRGLFAHRDMTEGEILLQIPASAMLNPLTLRGKTTIPEDLFPQTLRAKNPTSRASKKSNVDGSSEAGPSTSTRRLDTTQLLTLYLAWSRLESRDKQEWREYIETTPDSFRPWHPLTWLYPSNGDTWRKNLVELLPKGVRRKLEDVKRRYEADLNVLRQAVTTHNDLKPLAQDLRDEDLMWAWLNVNTRTVSIPLDLPNPSETHNHTLVPILDMINHSSSPSIHRPMQIASTGSIPLKRSYSSALAGPSSSSGGVPGKISFRLVAPPGGLKEDEEITFEYGSHSNATLFAEYGFIVRPRLRRKTSGQAANPKEDGAGEEEPSDNPWLNTRHGEVDLGHLVNDLFDKAENKQEKIDLIREMGYLDRYTLHTYPYPPYPSHTLIMALRILHLSGAELESKAKPLKSFALSYISPANELAVNKSLEGMLARAQREQKEAIPQLERMLRDVQGDSERTASVEMVMGLWEEQEAIVDAVLERVKSGDTSW